MKKKPVNQVYRFENGTGYKTTIYVFSITNKSVFYKYYKRDDNDTNIYNGRFRMSLKSFEKYKPVNILQ